MTGWEVMELHPKSTGVEHHFREGTIIVNTFEENEKLVKGPRPVGNHPFHLQSVDKKKYHPVVTHITALEAAFCPPQRSQHTHNRLNVDNAFCQKHGSQYSSRNPCSPLKSTLRSSLAVRDILLQRLVISSMELNDKERRQTKDKNHINPTVVNHKGTMKKTRIKGNSTWRLRFRHAKP